jgi:hypothetical protein
LHGGTLFLVDDRAEPVRRGRVIGPLPTKFFALDNEAQLIDHVQRLQVNEERHCRELYAAAAAQAS